MKHILNLNDFISEGLFKKDKYSTREVNDMKKSNEAILQSIYDKFEKDLSNEGRFKPDSWLRPGNLVPGENVNDQMITNWAGISLSYDIKNETYKLALPVKFNSNFAFDILSFIKSNFTITNNSLGGFTKVIEFN